MKGFVIEKPATDSCHMNDDDAFLSSWVLHQTVSVGWYVTRERKRAYRLRMNMFRSTAEMESARRKVGCSIPRLSKAGSTHWLVDTL